jgi:hypothetical protein
MGRYQRLGESRIFQTEGSVKNLGRHAAASRVAPLPDLNISRATLTLIGVPFSM